MLTQCQSQGCIVPTLSATMKKNYVVYSRQSLDSLLVLEQFLVFKFC